MSLGSGMVELGKIHVLFLKEIVKNEDVKENKTEQIKQIQKKQNIFGYECTYIWLIRYITDVTGAPDSFLGLLDGLIKEVVERDKDLYQRISEMVPNNDDDEPKEKKILLQLYLEQDFKNEGMEALLREKFENSVVHFLFLQKNTATLLPENLELSSKPMSCIFKWMDKLDSMIGQLFYKSTEFNYQDLLTCYIKKFKETDTQNFLEWFQKMVICLDDKKDEAGLKDFKEYMFALIDEAIETFIPEIPEKEKVLLAPYIETNMRPTNIIQSFQEDKTDFSTTGLVMFVLFILLI
jgi:hypothetical protein